MSFFGSSPLAWGVEWFQAERGWQRRFIPTRVGSCADRWPDDQASAVHPHSRGELLVMMSRNRLSNGSSPLAWGVDLIHHETLVVGRFIPTRVGS